MRNKYNLSLHKDIDVLRSILDRYFERAKNMITRNDPFIKPKLIYEKPIKGDLLVSVVTPVYNAERFVEDLHKSLEQQTLAGSVQWVVVNDGSTDGSLDKLLEIAKMTKLGGMKILSNPKNLGAAVTLDNAIQNSDSEVIAWVSADDAYVSEDKLEKDLTLIQQGYQLVFSKRTLIGTSPVDIVADVELNIAKISKFLYLSPELKLLWLSFNNFLNASSMVFRREIYNRVGGFDINLFNVDGDFDLIGKSLIASQGKLAFSDTVGFLRTHASQTSKNRLEMYVGINLTRIRFANFLKETGMVKNRSDAVFDILREGILGGAVSYKLKQAKTPRNLKAVVKKLLQPLRNFLFQKQRWFLCRGGHWEIFLPYLHHLYNLRVLDKLTILRLDRFGFVLKPSLADIKIFEEIGNLSKLYERTESFDLFRRNCRV